MKAIPATPSVSTASTRHSKYDEARANASTERKMVRTSSVDLVVQKPAEVAERIRALAESMGGFLVTSEVSGALFRGTASLTIRVPVASFEEARAEIRKLGLRVESEKVEAQDVTRQYVDQDANLRNLRAEEAQYLSILKQAHTVKDTLEVSDKLGEVRGEIEQQQEEFDALSKQIETVAIAISLQAEAEAQVFGLQWRPLYQLKLALHDGLDALANYAIDDFDCVLSSGGAVVDGYDCCGRCCRLEDFALGGEGILRFAEAACRAEGVKNEFIRARHASAAKADVGFGGLAARLKSCLSPSEAYWIEQGTERLNDGRKKRSQGLTPGLIWALYARQKRSSSAALHVVGGRNSNGPVLATCASAQLA
jgi:hypothetical protein